MWITSSNELSVQGTHRLDDQNSMYNKGNQLASRVDMRVWYNAYNRVAQPCSPCILQANWIA